jgi:hypothetical protein
VIFRREVIEFNLGDFENFYFNGFCEKKFWSFKLENNIQKYIFNFHNF